VSAEMEYALYRGDEFVAVGTARELARKRGVKPSTIRFMASPAYRRRDSGRGARVVAYRLEDDR